MVTKAGLKQQIRALSECQEEHFVFKSVWRGRQIINVEKDLGFLQKVVLFFRSGRWVNRNFINRSKLDRVFTALESYEELIGSSSISDLTKGLLITEERSINKEEDMGLKLKSIIGSLDQQWQLGLISDGVKANFYDRIAHIKTKAESLKKRFVPRDLSFVSAILGVAFIKRTEPEEVSITRKMEGIESIVRVVNSTFSVTITTTDFEELLSLVNIISKLNISFEKDAQLSQLVRFCDDLKIRCAGISLEQPVIKKINSIVDQILHKARTTGVKDAVLYNKLEYLLDRELRKKGYKQVLQGVSKKIKDCVEQFRNVPEYKNFVGFVCKSLDHAMSFDVSILRPVQDWETSFNREEESVVRKLSQNLDKLGDLVIDVQLEADKLGQEKDRISDLRYGCFRRLNQHIERLKEQVPEAADKLVPDFISLIEQNKIEEAIQKYRREYPTTCRLLGYYHSASESFKLADAAEILVQQKKTLVNFEMAVEELEGRLSPLQDIVGVDLQLMIDKEKNGFKEIQERLIRELPRWCAWESDEVKASLPDMLIVNVRERLSQIVDELDFSSPLKKRLEESLEKMIVLWEYEEIATRESLDRYRELHALCKQTFHVPLTDRTREVTRAAWDWTKTKVSRKIHAIPGAVDRAVSDAVWNLSLRLMSWF
jgi:hypothetical protein